MVCLPEIAFFGLDRGQEATGGDQTAGRASTHSMGEALMLSAILCKKEYEVVPASTV